MSGSAENRTEKVDFADTLLYFELVLLAVAMIAICVATIIGNSLVLLSFVLDKKLRTLTNYFLLSLAVSDMLIATFAMPLFTLHILSGEWTLGPVVCDLWLAQDYMCSMASSLNLLMICFDRYFSVVSPLRYRARRSGKLVAGMISCVWILSFMVWPPWILSWQYIEGGRTVPEDDCYVQFLDTNSYLTVVTTAIAYYIPVFIICVLYFRIWRETVRRKRFLLRMESEQHSTTQCPQAKASRRERAARGLGAALSCCYSTKQHTSSKRCSQQGSEQVELFPVTSMSKQITAGKLPNITTECDRKEAACSPSDDSGGEESSGSNIFSCGSSNHYDSNEQASAGGTELAITASTAKDSATGQVLTEVQDDGDATGVSNIPDESIATSSEPRSPSEQQPLANESVSLRVSSIGAEKTKKPDNKATRMLAAILSAFLITTTPYNVVVLVMNYDATLVPDAMWYFCYYMFYVNSTLNPMCYALANPQFRKTYWKILKCSWGVRVADGKRSNNSSDKSSQIKTSQVM